MTIKKLSIIIMVSITMTSCDSGKKDKKNIVQDPNQNPNTFNNPTYQNPNPFNSPESQQTAPISVNDLNRIKSSFNCTQGQRLSRDITYNIQSSQNSSSTTLSGPFTPGALPGGGNTVKTFVGISRFNDIMIVTKIANGNQVIGYNVTVSYCSMTGQNGAPYISDLRPVSNFRPHPNYGITLTENINCGFGSVDAAKETYAESAPIQYLPAFPIWTTFFTTCL